MTMYTLSGYFGSSDKEGPAKSKSKDEVVARFNLLTSDDRHFQYGVQDVLKQVRILKLIPSEIAFDLLLLAIMVQAADTRLNRLQTAQDAWCREIKIVLPVSDVLAWKATEESIIKMLRFLTGDRWNIEFRERHKKYKMLFEKKLFTDPVKYSDLNLFSGGMDSLIGAIDILNSGTVPLFISHAGEASVSRPQQTVFEKLKKAYSSKGNLDRVRLPSGKFPNGLFGKIGPESTTRGRSFLFFALGCFVGSALQKIFTLRAPENGLIALNIPLDSIRLGASSTRTTHPFYIHQWNELLKLLKIPGRVFNPYWNKTKGEMVKECLDQKLLKSVLKDSVSCAHPSWVRRWKAADKSHCGTCVPCIIRRASILTAWGKKNDPTGYLISDLTKSKLDSNKAEGNQVRSFQLAIKNLQEKPESAKIIIYKSGPLREDSDKIQDFVDVYTRGMMEVNELLKDVITYSSKY